MRTNKVEICGIDTSDIVTLKEEEKRRLLTLSREGDNEARCALVMGNLRLVLSVVSRFNPKHDGADDLFQVGCIGLIKAVNTFRSDKNIKLATYASRCIENEILMHFRSQKKLSAEVSMNETIDVDRDGNPLTYTDVISSEEDLPEDVMRSVEADRAMTLVRTRLDPRERQVITLRFGLNGAPALTQKEVAEQLGISQSYISRLEKRIIQRLKKEILRLS
mgnify:CR=1 FL=1